MELIHNPRCSKSRQAKELLEKKGVEFEVREYLKNELSENELSEILNKLGKEPQDILRKGEPVFKEKFKGKDLSNDQWIEAMVEFPKLIERPIVVDGNKAIIGRPPANVKELL